eukprot:g62004.t1
MSISQRTVSLPRRRASVPDLVPHPLTNDPFCNDPFFKPNQKVGNSHSAKHPAKRAVFTRCFALRFSRTARAVKKEVGLLNHESQ